MNWIKLKNNEKINKTLIPTITIEELREDFKTLNSRLANFFGVKEEENTRLYSILKDDEKGDFFVTSVLFEADNKSYPSLTLDYPQFHNFEREFFEEFKIEPKGHPWLKPIRKNQQSYEFFKMEGEEVHEVAVGPIHAGIIEPGHFRFQCHGEYVYNLEIMLGYQHRGIEKLFLKNHNNRLAESICGDSSIAHNLAYSNLIENLSNIKISRKARLIRLIALELERIAIHIGDLGAIAGDIAYSMGSAIYGTTRTLVINTMLEISGSRFGRGLIDVGGVNFDIDNLLSDKIIKTLDNVKEIVKQMTSTMLKMPTCISRMEKTGVVSLENVKILGAVGMIARSSGLDIDSRYNEIDYKNFERKPFKGTGDVYSRFKLRYKEINQSIDMVKKFLEELKSLQGDLKIKSNSIEANSFSLSTTEGWRGEVIHCAITNEQGKLERYKIKDPSFNNWYLLSLAVKNNGISDFPLCNKSFNMSYCGFDL